MLPEVKERLERLAWEAVAMPHGHRHGDSFIQKDLQGSFLLPSIFLGEDRAERQKAAPSIENAAPADIRPVLVIEFVALETALKPSCG